MQLIVQHHRWCIILLTQWVDLDCKGVHLLWGRLCACALYSPSMCIHMCLPPAVWRMEGCWSPLALLWALIQRSSSERLEVEGLMDSCGPPTLRYIKTNSIWEHTLGIIVQCTYSWVVVCYMSWVSPNNRCIYTVFQWVPMSVYGVSKTYRYCKSLF